MRPFRLFAVRLAPREAAQQRARQRKARGLEKDVGSPGLLLPGLLRGALGRAVITGRHGALALGFIAGVGIDLLGIFLPQFLRFVALRASGLRLGGGGFRLALRFRLRFGLRIVDRFRLGLANGFGNGFADGLAAVFLADLAGLFFRLEYLTYLFFWSDCNISRIYDRVMNKVPRIF